MATQIALDATGTKLNFDSNTFVIDESANRVGIGTASPSYPFHINNSSSASDNCNMLLTSGASGEAGIYFGDTGSTAIGRIYYDHSTNGMTFKTDATNRMTIDSSGKVGIGTTAPSEKLQVNGASGLDGATPPTIKIHSSTEGTWTDNATFAKLAFGNDDTSGGIACSINAYVDSTSGNNAGLSFYTSATANTPTERLRIDKAGNVGIGTTDPTVKLHITNTTNEDTLNSLSGILLTNTDTTNNSGSALVFSNSTASNGWSRIAVVRTDTETTDMIFSTMNGGNATEKLRIKSDGKVGIGTTSPEANSKIHVVGTTNFGSTDPAIIRFENTTATSKDFLLYQNSAGQFQIAQEDGSTRLLFNYDGDAYFGDSGKVGIDNSSPSGKLTVGDTHGVGDETNPAFVIGSSTYRFGIWTDAETAIFNNNNGDDGFLFKVKTAGYALKIDGITGNIGIGTTSPSKILDITSTTSGFLPPRMTTTQRDAISSPIAGEIIYNTTTNVLNFYDGSASAWGAV